MLGRGGEKRRRRSPSSLPSNLTSHTTQKCQRSLSLSFSLTHTRIFRLCVLAAACPSHATCHSSPSRHSLRPAIMSFSVPGLLCPMASAAPLPGTLEQTSAWPSPSQLSGLTSYTISLKKPSLTKCPILSATPNRP